MNVKHLLSTRGGGAVSAAHAIVWGLSSDGGLYVPDALPELNLDALLGLDYPALAARVMHKLMPGFESEELEEDTKEAYSSKRFGSQNPAPLKRVTDDLYSLELWHGPTLAFKDMALQMLPRLMTRALGKIGQTQEAFILVATSGDTGKAALEGFADVAGTRCAVFYPREGVSAMQRRQMVTQEGNNVHVIAVEGNFDDAQTGVKEIFADSAFAQLMKAQNRKLSSANSINWGRLAPQVVYYIWAYLELVRQGLLMGMPVNFVVPTGNFGNILAAWYAREMGVPIGKLICASNRNHVLYDFIRTGSYDRCRAFYKTQSPSMDILVSSNLERYLYAVTGGDAAQVASWMRELSTQGIYTVEGDALEAMKRDLYAGWADDQAGQKMISHYFEKHGYLCDPHTAVAFDVCRQYREETGDGAPTVVVSTASPYKFAGDVLAALCDEALEDEWLCCKKLEALSGLTIPASIHALEHAKVKHSLVCGKDTMRDAILTALEG